MKSVVALIFLLIFSGYEVFSQLVSINGNTFLMGCERGDSDEKPLHQVTLSSYKMEKHEVTEAQYDSCVRSGKCTPAHYSDGRCLAWTSLGFRKVNVPDDRKNPEFPVVCVTWFQAREYCQYKRMRLPTEAQWEFAATAGRSTMYSWGNQQPSSSLCAVGQNQKPDKVCSHGLNAAGLADMTGNVWEWTSDFYEKDYYSHSVKKDPTGPDVGFYRTIRGGGWYSSANQLLISNRNWFAPDFAEVSIGFRCISK